MRKRRFRGKQQSGPPSNGRMRRRRQGPPGGFNRRPEGGGGGAPEPEPVLDENGEVQCYEGYGMLEMHPNGYGFLRSPENNYSRERTDPFVPGTMIEKFRLRQGVMIKGLVQPGRRNQGPRLREIQDVDG